MLAMACRLEAMPLFIPKTSFDIERFLITAKCILGPLEVFVSHANGLKDVCLLLVIPQLDRESQSGIKILQTFLWIVAFQFNPRFRQENRDVFGINRVYLFQDGSRLIQVAVFFVEIGQSKKNIQVAGGTFGKSFVGFDCLRILFQNLRVRGTDQVFFLGGELFAKVDGFV